MAHRGIAKVDQLYLIAFLSEYHLLLLRLAGLDRLVESRERVTPVFNPAAR